jgi:hypothetical protein
MLGNAVLKREYGHLPFALNMGFFSPLPDGLKCPFERARLGSRVGPKQRI